MPGRDIDEVSHLAFAIQVNGPVGDACLTAMSETLGVEVAFTGKHFNTARSIASRYRNDRACVI